MSRLLARFGVSETSGDQARVNADPGVQKLKASLPGEIRTAGLERHDPAALLQIARVWHDRAALEELFARLLYQENGQSPPYDLQVLNELVALRDHARYRVHRVRRTVWDELSNG